MPKRPRLVTLSTPSFINIPYFAFQHALNSNKTLTKEAALLMSNNLDENTLLELLARLPLVAPYLPLSSHFLSWGTAADYLRLVLSGMG